MCGIAGYIGPAEISPERVHGCLQALGHRGPDQSGWRAWQGRDGNHVYLLHTRLSIIDLNLRASQPITIGKQTLVYNGELYNYRELRSCWANDVWRTESDSEVLLRAY